MGRPMRVVSSAPTYKFDRVDNDDIPGLFFGHRHTCVCVGAIFLGIKSTFHIENSIRDIE